jgi:hypothetical protein
MIGAKLVCFAVANLCAQAAFAWSLGTNSSTVFETKNEKLQKLLAFVKHDGRCNLAVTFRPRPSSKDFNSTTESPNVDLHCIGEVTMGTGTINEVKGCAAFYLSPATGAVVPMSNSHIFIKSKSCVDAYEEIAKAKVVYYEQGTADDFLIGEKFGRSASNGFPSFASSQVESYLVYSSDPKLTNWYFTKKAEVEKRIKAKYDAAVKNDPPKKSDKPSNPPTSNEPIPGH